MINATTWINPENTVASEISQTPKDQYCMISLVEISKFVETDSRLEFSRGGGKRRMSIITYWDSFFLGS